jgi:D-cysteine desulfhydrase
MFFNTVDSHFKIFRDDLYPFLGGGNKGRKIIYIEKDILAKKANSVVTTGGIQSNHCRALAILAAQQGWPCTLVLHGDETSFYKESGNAIMMRLSGARLVFVNEDKISTAMDQAMEDFKAQGLTPYYVYGGGHSMEGGLAYIDAVNEMKLETEQLNWKPDYIFLASGTGSTQAGILAGLDREGIEAEVIGISVGRNKDRAEAVVSDFYTKLCENYHIQGRKRKVTVLDDYLCGGYGRFNDAIKKLSLNSIKDYGFTLDTTYTAKAFYGMQDYISKNNLEDKNILFWHTGGIFNFLAEN